jgi:hypothetical protein
MAWLGLGFQAGFLVLQEVPLTNMTSSSRLDSVVCDKELWVIKAPSMRALIFSIEEARQRAKIEGKWA